MFGFSHSRIIVSESQKYFLFQPSKNAKEISATSPISSNIAWVKLILKCVPCVVTAERDAAYIGFVRTFVADLEAIARTGFAADRGEEGNRDLAEALELVASAFHPDFSFPRHVRTDALVVAQRAFDLARRTGVFLGKY